MLVTQTTFLEGVVPKGLLWAGVNGTSLWCQLKSTIITIFHLRDVLRREYATGRPFLMATFMNGPMVVLPRDGIRWYKSQVARGAIDFGSLQKEKLHMEYFSMINTDVDTSKYLNILHRLFTKSYVANLPDVSDEVARCLDALLGHDATNWKAVRCLNMVEKVVSASANRMMIGSPLCQDEQFLAAARGSAKLLFPIAVIVQALPTIVRPFVGGFFSLCTRYHWNILSRHVAATAQSLLDEGRGANVETSPTLMAKFVQEARKTPGCTELLSVSGLQSLVGVVNIAALSTTSINCTDILLNILSFHGSKELVKHMRNEATQLLASNMSVEALDSMGVMDSVCRESLRLENGDLFFVQGVVTQPLTLTEGQELPRGTRIALPAPCVHRDSELYPGNPIHFDPYRFLSGKNAKQSLAYQVSDSYLPFSFGPHACPGRWFAIAQIKIILSHMLLGYDFEALSKKPSAVRIGSYSTPSMIAKVRIRKRVGNVHERLKGLD